MYVFYPHSFFILFSFRINVFFRIRVRLQHGFFVRVFVTGLNHTISHVALKVFMEMILKTRRAAVNELSECGSHIYVYIYVHVYNSSFNVQRRGINRHLSRRSTLSHTPTIMFHNLSFDY